MGFGGNGRACDSSQNIYLNTYLSKTPPDVSRRNKQHHLHYRNAPPLPPYCLNRSSKPGMSDSHQAATTTWCYYPPKAVSTLYSRSIQHTISSSKACNDQTNSDAEGFKTFFASKSDGIVIYSAAKEGFPIMLCWSLIS